MHQLTLIHSKEFPIATYREALDANSIESKTVSDVSEASAEDGRLKLLLLDRALAANGRHFAGASRTAVIGVGLTGEADWSSSDRIYLHLPDDPHPSLFLSTIRRAYQYLFERIRNEDLERQLVQRTEELEEINKIGMALSTVRDHDELMEMILRKSRQLSRSDAGSLYLLDEIEGEGKVLRWKLAQNDSIAVDFQERILPITKKSLAGYVALTGETLVIDDAYQLPPNAEYSINRSFDEQTGYLTRSMLVLPMTNHMGDIIGVLQLINRKRLGAPEQLRASDVPQNVIPFDEHTIKLMRSLGGQAAVAVENNLLYDSIERLFEGFVTAAVTAIEQRDPTTSGHSFRVADLTVELAKTIDAEESTTFANIRFTAEQIREIRYASLLHDFGKVGVRENVLVKEKKLYPLQIDVIRARFEYAIKAAEAEALSRKLEIFRSGSPDADAQAAEIDRVLQTEVEKLSRDLEFIVQSNEPSVLPEGDFRYLQQLAEVAYFDLSGQQQRLLRDEEVKTLSIRKGNLDIRERSEIESHVTHTFRFLSKIPWTRDLRAVPEIAYAHHEKINGRGYPRGLGGEVIPIQSRMMTVSDIYDALTANDRPYKRAVPTNRALDILKMEMGDGLLDPAVVNLFIDAKIYERAGVVRA